MSIHYKTLFEVKLLHEFYLTSTSGNTIFSLNSQQDRLQFLTEEFNSERASLGDNLAFTFPEELEQTYKNYHLKLLSTYSGFKVAIRVNQKTLPDGSLVFEPFVPLPDKFGINVLFFKKDNAIDAFTNKRISTAIPATYFFSNNTVIGEPEFPFLTGAIPAVRGSYDYEQGELASFGAGNIAGFYINDFGSQWNDFDGSNFANENDRLLLPLQFYYSFPVTSSVTKVLFILKNKAGETISSFEFGSDTKMDKCLIDLFGIKDLLTAPVTAALEDFVFQLTVTGNDGYSNTHHIVIHDNFYSRDLWGMASVQPKTFNTDFDLFSNEGYLKKRRNAAGIWTDDLVFEIPVKSRFVYLRYINNKGKKLVIDPTTDIPNYLFEYDNKLLTRRPRSVAQSFFQVKEEGGTAEKYFPNPTPYNLKKDDKGRLCYDVMVTESINFPAIS
jgi:hypothetical protein